MQKRKRRYRRQNAAFLLAYPFPSTVTAGPADRGYFRCSREVRQASYVMRVMRPIPTTVCIQKYLLLQVARQVKARRESEIGKQMMRAQTRRDLK